MLSARLRLARRRDPNGSTAPAESRGIKSRRVESNRVESVRLSAAGGTVRGMTIALGTQSGGCVSQSCTVLSAASAWTARAWAFPQPIRPRARNAETMVERKVLIGAECCMRPLFSSGWRPESVAC